MKCRVCGAERLTTNHWFLMEHWDLATGTPTCRVFEWDDTISRRVGDPDSTLAPVCGMAHVLTLTARWLEHRTFDTFKPFVPQPEPERPLTGIEREALAGGTIADLENMVDRLAQEKSF
jgi:hypothetical protein